MAWIIGNEHGIRIVYGQGTLCQYMAFLFIVFEQWLKLDSVDLLYVQNIF